MPLTEERIGYEREPIPSTPVTPELTATYKALSRFAGEENMWVSGSYATGKATAMSDIDLLVGIPATEWGKVTLYDFPDIIKRLYDTLPEDKMTIHLYKLSKPNELWHFQRPRVVGALHYPGVFVPVDYPQNMVKGLWDKAIKPTLIPKAVTPVTPSLLEPYNTQYSLKQLQEIAKSAALSPSGLKQDLINRLVQEGVLK